MFCQITEADGVIIVSFPQETHKIRITYTKVHDMGEIQAAQVRLPNGDLRMFDYPENYHTIVAEGDAADPKLVEAITQAQTDAEALFREAVNAVIEDKPLNLTDFELKPKPARKTTSKAKTEGE